MADNIFYRRSLHPIMARNKIVIETKNEMFGLRSFRTGTSFSLPNADVPVQAYDFSPVTTILQLFSRFFTPFLSCKRLISRRLQKNGTFFCAF
jgi:hypothetical protein